MKSTRDFAIDFALQMVRCLWQCGNVKPVARFMAGDSAQALWVNFTKCHL